MLARPPNLYIVPLARVPREGYCGVHTHSYSARQQYAREPSVQLLQDVAAAYNGLGSYAVFGKSFGIMRYDHTGVRHIRNARSPPQTSVGKFIVSLRPRVPPPSPLYIYIKCASSYKPLSRINFTAKTRRRKSFSSYFSSSSFAFLHYFFLILYYNAV